MQTEPTYYEILQVREDASPAIIKAAHRELMRSVHPDVNVNAPTPAAAVNEARDVLSDPERRQQYDDDLLAERGHRQREAWAENTGSAGPGGGAPGAHDPGASDPEHAGRGHATSGMWGQEVPWASEGPPAPPGSQAPPHAQPPPESPDGHFQPEPGQPTAESDAAQWGFVSAHESQCDHPPQGQSYDFGEPHSSPVRASGSRMAWLSQWPIAVWMVLWVGAQAVADALNGRAWTGLLSAAILVLIGWLAGRKRSRGGRISKRYILWLLVGVALIAVTYATSLPSALLFGFFYLSWILSTEWSNRLSQRSQSTF